MLKIDFGYKLTTIRIRIILNNAMWGWFATEKFSWEQSNCSNRLSIVQGICPTVLFGFVPIITKRDLSKKQLCISAKTKPVTAVQLEGEEDNDGCLGFA